MARSINTDFLQLFKFRVTEPANFLNPVAGFSAVTVPDFSSPEVTYREGLYVFTRKYPGIPEFTNITLSRGVARAATDFFNWMMQAIRGQEYRTTIEIQHFHRTDQKQPSARYILKEAFPVRMRPSADLDANTPDVAVEELEIAFEELEVKRIAGGLGQTISQNVVSGSGTVVTQ
jgi:phage tail-like protein